MDTVAFAILITATCLSHVTGNFVLEVRVHAYNNPTHAASAFATGAFNRDCCDPQPSDRMNDTFCVSVCDNIFIFCFREAGRRDTNTNGSDGSNCLYGRSVTKVIEQDNDNLTFTVGETFPGGVPNPVVAFGETWPGSIQLAIQTIDHDFNMTGDDDIDIFFIDINSTIGIDFSAPMTYVGVNGYGQIQLSFRLSCTENYYGPDCATFCMERDDDLGRYTCDSDGSLVCRQGYQDPSSFCTTCIPAEECSPDGGFCNVPGECICFDGYDGDNCLLGPPVPGSDDEMPSENENTSVPGDGDDQDTGSSGVAVGVVVGGVITGLLGLTIIILIIIIYLRCRNPTNTYIPDKVNCCHHCTAIADDSIPTPGDNLTYSGEVGFHVAPPGEKTNAELAEEHEFVNPLYSATAPDHSSYSGYTPDNLYVFPHLLTDVPHPSPTDRLDDVFYATPDKPSFQEYDYADIHSHPARI